MDLNKLSEPFGSDDIEYRIGQSGKTRDGKPWAKVLAYITNRAIMARLDAVCGPAHWANDFRPAPNDPKHESLLCGIGIEVATGQWVWKWDGANNTDFEAVKGGISDSMKRAAVQWGMGRELYSLGELWADCSEEDHRGQDGWRYAKTKDGTFWWRIKPAAATGKSSAKARAVAATRGAVRPASDPEAIDYKRVVKRILANVCKCENEEQADAVINCVTNGMYTAVSELDKPEDAKAIHEALSAYGETEKLEGLAHALEVGSAFDSAASVGVNQKGES